MFVIERGDGDQSVLIHSAAELLLACGGDLVHPLGCAACGSRTAAAPRTAVRHDQNLDDTQYLLEDVL